MILSGSQLFKLLGTASCIYTCTLCVLQVDFPAVTICSPGRMQLSQEAAYYNLFLNFLKEERSLDLQLNGFQVANIVNNVSDGENTVVLRIPEAVCESHSHTCCPFGNYMRQPVCERHISAMFHIQTVSHTGQNN